MPGLFGMETPEEVRSRIGRTGREQDLQLARLAPGRGQVALASQLGRGAVAGGAQLLGAPSPAETTQRRNKAIQDSIAQEASSLGITKEKDPFDYISLSARVLMESGQTEAASNALAFGTQLKKLTSLDDTALVKEAKSIFNVPANATISSNPKAAEWVKKMREIASTQVARPIRPPQKPVGKSAQVKAVKDISAFISEDNPLTIGEDTYTSAKASDFVSADNHVDFARTLARTAQNILDTNNATPGAAPMSETEASRQAFEQLKPFIRSQRNQVFGQDIPLTQDMFFDINAFKSEAGVASAVADVELGVGTIQNIGDR